ncbi:MAG: hypothetical protein D6B27_02380 [Gammaproteobacteria bacterium]|nr:MAG: hypothetical protein D6B27_02380 [Gammaproteobacteria bacterium]
MQEIYWELGQFSISMQGRYSNIDDLEKDIELLYGSEDFGGFSGNDWFLLNKKTDILEFLSLTVPSFFFDMTDEMFHLLRELKTINFKQFTKMSASKIIMQDSAFFSADKDILLVSSSPLQIKASTALSENFSLLSDDKGEYLGFILYNATKNIYGYDPDKNNDSFIDYLQDMLTFCDEQQYELMDDEDEELLQKLNTLEYRSADQFRIDPRAEHILSFVKNVKLTFYDIVM